MKKTLEIETTVRVPNTVTVDISDEAIKRFGDFTHGEVAIHPNKEFEITIMGVAPDNNGEDVLWYVISHPRIMGRAYYWGGEKNLQKAGFTKKQSQ